MKEHKKMRSGVLGGLLLAAVLCFPIQTQAATLKLNHKSLTMYTGDAKTLKATTSLKGKITWKSSNKKVASVSNKGRVKAKKAGTAVITAKIKANKVKCKITVKKSAGLKETAKKNAKTYSKQIKDILKYTNQYRTRQGLPKLILDTTLTRAACHRSLEMADAGVLSHERPDGSTPFDLMKEYGISYYTAGENIAYTMGYGVNAGQAAQMWYNSTGHRENMLNSDFGKIGIGIAVTKKNEVYYTQLFTN